jgi:hypothetical protein
VCVGIAGPNPVATRTRVAGRAKEDKTMMQVYNEMRQSHSRVNEIVAEVLSTTVLVLAGIVAVAQFAYY